MKFHDVLNQEPHKFGNQIPTFDSSHIPNLTIQKSLPYKLATIELKTTQEKTANTDTNPENKKKMLILDQNKTFLLSLIMESQEHQIRL